MVERPISSLKPFERNARTHSAKQISQIAASIQKFGFTNPVLVDQDNMIIAGHGRVAAARLLNHTAVPTIQIEHLNDAQKRAYILADNKIAANVGWDREILAIELQHLTSIDIDFDLEITGFATAEIDFIMDGHAAEQKSDPADQVPAPNVGVVTGPGDTWILGDHKIVCGDARRYDTFSSLLDGERARLMFADPPYNVSIESVGGLGAIKHREFAMASGEMTKPQFTAFLSQILSHAANASVDGAIHFVCMDWRHIGETLVAGEAVYSTLKIFAFGTKTTAAWARFIDQSMS